MVQQYAICPHDTFRNTDVQISKDNKHTSKASKAIQKAAVFALELMNVVSQKEQQLGVSYGLMIPSSKKEELKTEITSALQSITKNIPAQVLEN
jgi:hypothetical protein